MKKNWNDQNIAHTCLPHSPLMKYEYFLAFTCLRNLFGLLKVIFIDFIEIDMLYQSLKFDATSEF